jgi:hypothetical protein
MSPSMFEGAIDIKKATNNYYPQVGHLAGMTAITKTELKKLRN